MHTNWEKAQVDDNVVVKIETDVNSKMIDPYCCKILTKNEEQRLVTVGHIPREISRYVYFFLRDEGGSVHGQLTSTQYRPSPIPAGGLEVPLKLTFSCSRFVIFNRIKELITQYNYDDELKLLDGDDNEPEGERPEGAEQVVQSIAEIEVEDEDNSKERDSESDEDTFGAYFSNLTDAEENDENDENNSEDLDDQPKKKKLKRIRISSSEEEDN